MNRLWLALLLVVVTACTGADRRADTHLKRARTALDAGKLDQARSYAEQAHETSPEDPSTREVLAGVHRAIAARAEERGDLARAADAYVRAAQHEPYRKVQASDWYRAWTNATDAGRDPLENAAYLNAALEANPNDLEVRRTAATTYDEIGETEVAILHYLWLWEADRSDLAIGLRLGTLYASAGRTRDAEAIFSRVVESDPDNVQAKIQLADLYEQMNRGSRARSIYRKLLEQHPANASLLFRWADFLERQGNLAEAGRVRARARGELPGVERREMRELPRRR